MVSVVGVPAVKVAHICNGVDTERFTPRTAMDDCGLPESFLDENSVVIGSVTRFSAIKDPINLIEAFLCLYKKSAEQKSVLRLIMIGDGELRGAALSRLEEAGLLDVAWLPGSRDDIPAMLRVMDVFVLGSYREGISNTILEAMATGLPIIATTTGGNTELIEPGINGVLVPPAESQELANAIAVYVNNSDRRVRHGQASRDKVLADFSIRGMIKNYENMYFRALAVEGF
jgi:glycosyltransferase involved in cell wall biosynthesis